LELAEPELAEPELAEPEPAEVEPELVILEGEQSKLIVFLESKSRGCELRFVVVDERMQEVETQEDLELKVHNWPSR
jgi:hypothetical protein